MTNRDEIKQAAEIEIAVNDPGDRSVYFARAYLDAIAREDAKDRILDAIEKSLMENGLRDFANRITRDRAAIKAAEEGR